MVTTHPKPTLESRVLKTEYLNWRAFHFIQQEEFKDLSGEAHEKLRASILANNFTQPFYVWEKADTGQIFCLDGKHRIRVLEELSKDGYDIPDTLPATFIYCKDEKEAARLVLIYSSIYAKVTQQGLFDFIQMYELDYTEMRDQLDLPDFSTDRYEQKFDVFQVRDDKDEYEVEEETGEIKVQPGDVFQLGPHRVICGSFLDPGVQDQLMEGKKARILICDPPYNLPANFFTNKDEKRHEDFAMGAGEMSDEEFVVFLEAIMKGGVNHTVEGGIHYVFMDWRHVWHMTEAGRRVYGSVIPKQLCVWKKDNMANGSFYRAQQELCFVFGSPAAKNLWNRDLLDEGGFYKDNDELVFIFKNGEGAKHLSHLDMADRIRTNVWNYPSAVSIKNPDRYLLKDHPTPKPVAMIADAILDTTNPGEGVIDWFLGSGTALIAAEKTGRVCYATEIKPQYVQSIIKRYVLFCTKNNKPVDFQHVNGNLTLNDFRNESTIAGGKI